MKNSKKIIPLVIMASTLLFGCQNNKEPSSSSSSSSSNTPISSSTTPISSSVSTPSSTPTPSSPSSTIEATKLAAPVISRNDLIVSWDKVPNAEKYEVYINGELDSTQIMNKYEIPLTASDIRIVVYAISSNELFLKSDASNELAYKAPTSLSAPVISMTGNVVSWAEVENAREYSVYINGEYITRTTETSYTINSADLGAYSIYVTANYGSLTSEHSNVLTYKNLPEKISTRTTYDRAAMYEDFATTGEIDTGVGEGFDMKSGSKATFAHAIDETTKFLTVSIRVFHRDGETYPSFSVKVDGEIVRAEGADKDTVTVETDASQTFVYDLSSKVGETVFIEFAEAAATHCVLTQVKFIESMGAKHSDNTSWDRTGLYDEWYMEGEIKTGVGEGLDLAGSGKASIKVTPKEETKLLNVTFRQFENQDSVKARVQVTVNDKVIRATGTDTDYAEGEINDTRYVFCYDLSEYVGKEVKITIASVAETQHCVITAVQMKNVDSSSHPVIVPDAPETTDWNKASIISDWTISGGYNSGVGEGFDMQSGCTISKELAVTSAQKYLNISARMFVSQDTDQPELVVKVNDTIVKGVGIGNDYTSVILSDKGYVYTYDLSEYVGQTVTVSINQRKSGVNHCVVQKISLSSTDDHTIFAQPEGVKQFWTKADIISDWNRTTGNFNEGVGEGYDMQAGCTLEKEITVTEDCKYLNIQVRMFNGQDTNNPHLALKVGDSYVKVVGTNDNYANIQIRDDGRVYTYDLSAYVGQTITVTLVQEQAEVNHCVLQFISLQGQDIHNN